MRRCILLLFVLWMTLPAHAQGAPFAEGLVDIESPYIGQPIVFTLRIFTTQSLENSTIVEPSFFGFGRSEIIFEPRTYTETRFNIGYNVVEQQYVVYALRAGELSIDPFRVEIPETPFSDSVTLFSNVVTITAQDFPQPAPTSFVNGVGQFDMSITATPTQLNSGDILDVSLTISGTGNLDQMLAPILNLPDDWRILDGQTTTQQDSLRFGSKTFEWSVIVLGEGEAVFPAIEYSYFNPQTNQYEMRRTASIGLVIAPSTSQPQVTIERTQIALTPIPIPELMTVTSDKGLPVEPPLWSWVLWLIPPIFAFVVWLIGRPKVAQEITVKLVKTRHKQATHGALRRLQIKLKEAQSVDPKMGYQQIANALYDYLGTKTGVAVSADNIAEVISNFPDGYQQALLSYLEEARTGQYAPITQEDAKVLSQRVIRVCKSIEKIKK